MKKDEEEDDLEPEYDLRKLLKESVRGKYAERFQDDAGPDLARGLLESREDLMEAECLAEAERRQQEVREGRVKLVPGDEVKALLDRVLG